MSMVTYPLNNVEYTAEDAELFHVTRTSGVYANNSFDYSLSGADNTVVIGKGIAWIKNSEFSGKVVAQKEAVSLNMGLPDANYPRIDAIIIKFDANSNSTDIVVKEGTASSNPIAPVVTRTESIYELHLYHVRRNAGSLYIVANDITDLRTDNNYCGLMADSVTAIDAVPFERRINGYTLEQDINLTASDVGAVPTSRTVNGKALSTNIVFTAEDLEALEKTGETLWSGDVTSGTTLSLTSAYTEYTLIIVEWGMVGLSNAKKHDVFYVPSISGTMCVTGNDASATLTFNGTSVTVGVIAGVRLYKVIGIK